MDAYPFAAVNLNELTKTRSSGRPVNIHVSPAPGKSVPDYEKMRQLVHSAFKPAEPEKEPVR